MSVEYSAIAAKLKAMYSKFLTRDDYEQLLERKSVNDICSYLKSTPGYGEVLEQVNERDIHRGQMEILLEQEMVSPDIRPDSVLRQLVSADQKQSRKTQIRRIFFPDHSIDQFSAH